MEQETVHKLLVEDDVMDREALKRMLDNLGITNPLHEARNGLGALVLMRSEGGSFAGKRFFILLDLNRPRMTGFEFLKQLRADKGLKGTAVFVLTSSGRYEDVGEAWKYNMAGRLDKRDLEQKWCFSRM